MPHPRKSLKPLGSPGASLQRLRGGLPNDGRLVTSGLAEETTLRERPVGWGVGRYGSFGCMF